MAGFEVTTNGRIWVTTEVMRKQNRLRDARTQQKDM
jgi:hypothetical protein